MLLGVGHFTYINTSVPSYIKETFNSSLVSQLFHPTNESCMTFWFYIYGPGYVGLFVDISLEYNLNSTLLHIDGQPKNEWTKATVSINSEQNYRVRLKSYLCMVGSSFNLD